MGRPATMSAFTAAVASSWSGVSAKGKEASNSACSGPSPGWAMPGRRRRSACTSSSSAATSATAPATSSVRRFHPPPP